MGDVAAAFHVCLHKLLPIISRGFATLYLRCCRLRREEDRIRRELEEAEYEEARQLMEASKKKGKNLPKGAKVLLCASIHTSRVSDAAYSYVF